jgi:hypothetical protein
MPQVSRPPSSQTGEQIRARDGSDNGEDQRLPVVCSGQLPAARRAGRRDDLRRQRRSPPPPTSDCQAACPAPFWQEASLAQAAAQVDLETFTITTPLGHYHITETDESSVTFNGQSSNGYVITGMLDRSSGQMSIRWLSKHEQAEFDRTGQAEIGMSADLKCSRGTRPF